MDIHFKEDGAAIGETAFIGRNAVGRINFHESAKKKASWISYLPFGPTGLRTLTPKPVKDQITARRELIESIRSWLKACEAA